jgi:ketosteroid isomerase-like protein
MSVNLDLVRSIYADLERGDFVRAFQTGAEWAHPEFEWIVADGPTAGSFAGIGEATESVSGMLAVWEEFRWEVEEYHTLDDDRVLVLERRRGRGKGSGVETNAKAATLFHFRDGKLARIVGYWERDRAFADLGLEE